MIDPIAEATSILSARAHGKVTPGAPIGPLTSYRLGGPAGVLLDAAGPEDLDALAAARSATGLEILVVGRGSNMLVSDRGFPGIVVRLGSGFRWADAEGEGLSAGAAFPLPALASLALDQRLGGIEFAVAIPASLGGAVRMNAGAHGGEMSSVLASVDVYDVEAGQAATRAATELDLTYRRSNLGPLEIVTAATLTLAPAEEDEIFARMDEARRWRKATQPLNLPNGGSVFTNPPGDHAARLIEAAGAKGMRVGGASVSEVHANFIVAEPGATADQVYTLMRRIKRLIAEQGIELVEELRLVGTFEEVER